MLELKNITLKWNSPTEKTLIKNLSIKIENSEILCVFGESGVGKSSLINVISGVNEENLNIEGEIKLNGIKLNNIAVYTCCNVYPDQTGWPDLPAARRCRNRKQWA